MLSPSVWVLTALIAWALALIVLMEVMRTRLVVLGRVVTTAFRPDNANLSPFMQRLTRAHANCLEGLPIFGGLLIVALVTDRGGLTDGLAWWLLAARILQSLIHLASTNVWAVNARFAAFAVQLGIAAYWVFLLLRG
ncbi:MAG: MAPEG family protein [Rhodanobacteraceae bacterium]